jgi:hypothetical protein
LAAPRLVSGGLFRAPLRLIRLIRYLPVLWSNGSAGRRKLFDAAFYLRKYPDVAAAKANPWLHYLKHGAAEGRKPHPLFQPDYYLMRCQEARSRGADPLAHFSEARSGNWASPHPLFDCERYIASNPDVAAQGINPLVHYLRSGRGESSSMESAQNGLRRETLPRLYRSARGALCASTEGGYFGAT